MSLDSSEIAKLRRIIAISEKLIAVNPKRKRGRPALAVGKATSKLITKRTRRTGKDLVKFKKVIKAEITKGVPVAEIARKHGVTTSYIYQI